MLKTTLTRTLLAAAVLAVAAAPAASAKSPAKFTAAFEATYKTNWDMPTWMTGASCFRKNFSYGFGEETWTIKTRRAGRVTATKIGIGRNASVRIDGIIDAFGVHKRDGGTFVRWEPGDCGGDAGIQPNPNDCGTRLPEYDLRFETEGTKLYPNAMTAGHMRREKLHFADCEIRLSDGLTSNAWPKVTGSYSANALFGSRRQIVVKGAEAWDDVFNPGRGGETTTKSTLNWKLTLTRTR